MMSVYENVCASYEWMKCTIWTSDLVKIFYSINLNYFNSISDRCKQILSGDTNTKILTLWVIFQSSHSNIK